MSNFINDCLQGTALLQDITRYVDQWHQSNQQQSLAEFLGMNEMEFMYFLKNEQYLPYIILAHKEGIPVTQVIQTIHNSTLLCNDPGRAVLTNDWLNDQNLWH